MGIEPFLFLLKDEMSRQQGNRLFLFVNEQAIIKYTKKQVL